MPAYQPPFQLTHRMTARVADIAERLGEWKAAHRGTLVPELRRGNRIRSLQASLAIEQNTLSVEQVTAVLAGKPVLGSPKEVQEVRNAFAAYETTERWQPHRLADLLQATRTFDHHTLGHGCHAVRTGDQAGTIDGPSFTRGRNGRGTG